MMDSLNRTPTYDLFFVYIDLVTVLNTPTSEHVNRGFSTFASD